MANRERGEVALVLSDGRELTLRLTTNSCCLLEERSGKSFEEWNELWAKEHRMLAFRWMVWAALLDKHGDVARTPEAVGALIDQCDQGELMRVMMSFLILQTDEFKQLVAAGILAEGGPAANPLIAQAGLAGAPSTSTPASSV